MGAAASLSAAAAKDPSSAIREGRGHAQLACAQLRRALLQGRVPGHVTVVVDLAFAKQTLAFHISGQDVQAHLKNASNNASKAYDTADEHADHPAAAAAAAAAASSATGSNAGAGEIVNSAERENHGPIVFPPASVAAMVKDVKRLTAAVSAHNLDAALQSAAATRCFLAGKILFLVTVSIDPRAFASAQAAASRPSLIRGKTVREVADGLDQSQSNGESKEAAALQARQDKIMAQLKTSGIMLKKHPRKGSPEPRTFWFTGERFCIAKKVQSKVNHRTKGWAVDDPNGFDVVKGVDSPNFKRTLKKYGDVDPEVCLVIQLHDRTIDLQVRGFCVFSVRFFDITGVFLFFFVREGGGRGLLVRRCSFMSHPVYFNSFPTFFQQQPPVSAPCS